METTIDTTIPVYPYEQIAAKLREAIASGEFPSKVPSVTELAKMFNVAPGTAARALHILRDEGLVVGRPGLGTFVRKPE